MSWPPRAERFRDRIADRSALTVAAAVALVAALTLAGGCGGDTARPATGTATTATAPNLGASLGIGGSVSQYRRDEAARVVQLKAVAGPDTPPSRITSAQLRWVGMTPVSPIEADAALTAGRRVDLPSPLGPAACGPLGDVAPGDSPSAPPLDGGVIRLTLDVPGEGQAVSRTVEAPLLPEAEAPLRRIFEHDCQRQSMLRAVEVAFSPRWQRSDATGTPAAEGTLVLTRGATDRPISVASVNGSVLLGLSLAEGGGAVERPTMPPDRDRLEVPVRVAGSGRCDGHALGGSSQTYALQVAIGIGGAAPVGVTVSPDAAGRALLARVIADTCGGP